MNTVILAIGNAGGNIAESIRSEKKGTLLESARYVYADTSTEDLQRHGGEENVLIGLRPEDDSFPRDVFVGVERLIVVAGLGGRTATKFTMLAIEAAKACGVDSMIVVVTIPFLFEGSTCIERAVTAANCISKVEGVKFFVFNNQELMERYSGLNFVTAFEKADEEIVRIILNEI